MRTRILWNNLKGNPLLAVTTWLFITVSAFMFALTCFLAIGLLGSVDGQLLLEEQCNPKRRESDTEGLRRQCD